MSSPDNTTVTLKSNSARVSSVGEIRWKLRSPSTPPKAPIGGSSDLSQVALVHDDDAIDTSSVKSHSLEPLRLYITGKIPVAQDWQITKMLPVEIEFDGEDTVVAYDLVFNRYGVGESIDEALDELKDNLFVYFDIVKEYTNENRPANQALLAHLEEFIVYNAG